MESGDAKEHISGEGGNAGRPGAHLPALHQRWGWGGEAGRFDQKIEIIDGKVKNIYFEYIHICIYPVLNRQKDY